jgi:hypothetical protein
METTQMSDVEKRRTYMREYKRKKYAEDAEKILAKNRAYYCKATRNVPEADFKKYDVMLPTIARVREGLEILRQSNPEMLTEIINHYK